MQNYFDAEVYMHKSEAGKHSQFVKNITFSVQFLSLIHDMLLVFYI